MREEWEAQRFAVGDELKIEVWRKSAVNFEEQEERER